MLSDDQIFSGKDAWEKLSQLIKSHKDNGVFILAGENTSRLCLPVLKAKCSYLSEARLIVVKGNEAAKNIEGVKQVWAELSQAHALRTSLLICLGGGVITDLGGFAAATYKRGMNFIHIPTTLLAMVDASIGGKTGINLDNVKNQVGVFANPLGVFIFPEFLATLPHRQLVSGFAEVVKHVMLDGYDSFAGIVQLKSLNDIVREDFIRHSAEIKMEFVRRDVFDSGIRRVLNFGHTIGHAVEALSLKNPAQALLHGEAIAIGLVCESYISVMLAGLAENTLKIITELIFRHFSKVQIPVENDEELYSLMLADKKNDAPWQINFTLLDAIGKPVTSMFPSKELIFNSIKFYRERCGSSQL